MYDDWIKTNASRGWDAPGYAIDTDEHIGAVAFLLDKYRRKFIRHRNVIRQNSQRGA